MSWPDLAGRLEGDQHILPVRIYYEDTDFSGVVYHGAYVRFLERGRSDYLRLLGVDQGQLLDAEGAAFAVRSMTLDFLKAGRIDDVLEIVTSVAELGGASLTLAQQIRRSHEILLTANIRIGLVAKGRARRFPEAILESFQRR